MKLTMKEHLFLELLDYISEQEIRDLEEGLTTLGVLLDPDDLEIFEWGL